MSQDEVLKTTKVKIEGFIPVTPEVVQELAQSLGNMIYQHARTESTLFVLSPLLESPLRERVEAAQSKMEDVKTIIKELFQRTTLAAVRINDED